MRSFAGYDFVLAFGKLEYIEFGYQDIELGAPASTERLSKLQRKQDTKAYSH